MGGKRVLSAAANTPGAAMVASNAIANIFLIFFLPEFIGLNAIDRPPDPALVT